MMSKEIINKAKYFDGQVPECWMFVGMQMGHFVDTEIRKRFYETSEGEYYFTVQKIKKKREPRIETRQENGCTFASRRWKRRKYEVW